MFNTLTTGKIQSYNASLTHWNHISNTHRPTDKRAHAHMCILKWISVRCVKIKMKTRNLSRTIWCFCLHTKTQPKYTYRFVLCAFHWGVSCQINFKRKWIRQRNTHRPIQVYLESKWELSDIVFRLSPAHMTPSKTRWNEMKFVSTDPENSASALCDRTGLRFWFFLSIKWMKSTKLQRSNKIGIKPFIWLCFVSLFFSISQIHLMIIRCSASFSLIVLNLWFKCEYLIKSQYKQSFYVIFSPLMCCFFFFFFHSWIALLFWI